MANPGRRGVNRALNDASDIKVVALTGGPKAPAAIDLARYSKRPDSTVAAKKKFTIGWTGLASNYPFLKLIEEFLLRFLQNHPDVEMLIVAERPWRSTTIPPEIIRFVRWNKQVETTASSMPLTDSTSGF
jgi:hypothetical protein